jgi:hypothetical protein
MLIGVLVSALRFDAIQHNTVLVFSLLTPNPTQTQRLVSPSWNSNIKPQTQKLNNPQTHLSYIPIPQPLRRQPTYTQKLLQAQPPVFSPGVV